jgi:hypothetical protein
MYQGVYDDFWLQLESAVKEQWRNCMVDRKDTRSKNALSYLKRHSKEKHEQWVTDVSDALCVGHELYPTCPLELQLQKKKAFAPPVPGRCASQHDLAIANDFGYTFIAENRDCRSQTAQKKAFDRDEEQGARESTHSENMDLKRECTSTCVEPKCGNKRFTSDLIYPTRQFSVANRDTLRGNGLVANVNINADSFVLPYTGDILTGAQARRRQEDQRASGDGHFYLVMVDADVYIDAKTHGNLSRFMNHSCQPNCVSFRWMVNGNMCLGLVAKNTVAAGTELTFDYRLPLHEKWDFVCECGSEACRQPGDAVDRAP